MRSPHTIGEALPRPGISTFQVTFFVSLHSSGGLAVDETPVACGPRHCAQKRMASGCCCAAGIDENTTMTMKTGRHNRLRYEGNISASVTASIVSTRRTMQPFDFHPRTRVVFREGGLALVGELARSLGFTRTLIVADRGMQAAGLVDRAIASLNASAITTIGFHEFEVNPDSAMVEAGRHVAAESAVDSIV